MKIFFTLICLVFALYTLVWLGLQIKPKSFPPFPLQSSTPQTVPLPKDLPAPVELFYHQLYGDEIPVIESAVITGRARMRIKGISFPGRFRFTHDAGQGYRHYIEATFFGLPIFKVNERYLDGTSCMELPFGTTENESQVNQGANLGLWGESMWLPSIYVTDPRVHWEPIDEVTALLSVPFGEEQERFVVRFDPETGMPYILEAMRYKSEESETKTLWLDQLLEWNTLDEYTLFTVGAVTWFDDGKPWAVFSVEQVVFNADVQAYLRLKGL